MSASKKFLEQAALHNLTVTAAGGRLTFSGPKDMVNFALEAMREYPSLEGEVLAYLLSNPRTWLELHEEDIRKEHAARTRRLERAGIGDAEAVSLDTTFADHNSTLPKHLKPIIGYAANESAKKKVLFRQGGDEWKP
jgi:hypothetical protein